MDPNQQSSTAAESAQVIYKRSTFADIDTELEKTLANPVFYKLWTKSLGNVDATENWLKQSNQDPLPSQSLCHSNYR